MANVSVPYEMKLMHSSLSLFQTIDVCTFVAEMERNGGNIYMAFVWEKGNESKTK